MKEGIKVVLNIDQQRVVDSDVNGHMLIRGVAGSGKTTVAVARIPILLEHYCEAQDKVLLLTYNRTLTNYINHIYKKTNQNQTMLTPLNSKDNISIKTIDSIIYKLFKELGYKPNVPKEDRKRNIIEYVIKKLESRFKYIPWFRLNNKEFILKEIEWMNACGYDDIKTYQNVDRLGRSHQSKKSGGQGVQRINKNSKQREALFEAYKFYYNIMRKQKLYDYTEMARVVVENADQLNLSKYTHILIDEAQDLSKRQLEMIKLLYIEKEHSSIIFITDTAQSIYDKSWLSYHSFSTINFNMGGRARILSKNYRTTKQIAMAAYSLIDNDEGIITNELYVKPQVVEREGPFPVYNNFQGQEEEYAYITDKIKQLNKKYNLKDIVVLTKTKAQRHLIKDFMVTKGVDAEVYDDKTDFEGDKIKLFTMHGIKGLEFKVIFICGLNEGIIPYIPVCKAEDSRLAEINDKKLLYVGMTRAEDKLYLTSCGEESRLIKDISKEYLRSTDVEPFEQIKKPPLSSFYFEDKIYEKHSKEEGIRQGLIREIVEVLGYPLDNINIEVPVKRFSRTGYADIVAFKTSKKEKPLLVIEAKNPEVDINDHIQQLHDYMLALPSVRFGLISNGNNHCFYEKVGSKLLERKTIPSYENVITTTDKRYVYRDFMKNREFLYIQSGYDQRNITVKYIDEEGVLPVGNYENINMLGKVSAGLLREIRSSVNYESDSHIPIPGDWLQKGYRYMMLKADGDSMINAGIDHGDYVLVRLQQHIENYEIAVAVVDDSATMKKIVKMDSNVMLMPENSNYQPIIKPSHEVYINGKVIGVLKNS